MVHSITGTLTILSNNTLCLLVNGIEWECNISTYTAEKLSDSIGNSIKILTWLQASERGLFLYGFSTVSEKVLFMSLLKVDGVGPKAAIKILSHTTPEMLSQYIKNKDTKRLSTLPGIGAKKASKILLTIEDVFVPVSLSPTQEKAHTNSVSHDILQGLLSMGYTKDNAESALATAWNNIVDNDASKTPNEGVLMREAILLLSQSEL